MCPCGIILKLLGIVSEVDAFVAVQVDLLLLSLLFWLLLGLFGIYYGSLKGHYLPLYSLIRSGGLSYYLYPATGGAPQNN